MIAQGRRDLAVGHVAGRESEEPALARELDGALEGRGPVPAILDEGAAGRLGDRERRVARAEIGDDHIADEPFGGEGSKRGEAAQQRLLLVAHREDDGDHSDTSWNVNALTNCNLR